MEPSTYISFGSFLVAALAVSLAWRQFRHSTSKDETARLDAWYDRRLNELQEKLDEHEQAFAVKSAQLKECESARYELQGQLATMALELAAIRRRFDEPG